jgi:hypothetical protein
MLGTTTSAGDLACWGRGLRVSVRSKSISSSRGPRAPGPKTQNGQGPAAPPLYGMCVVFFGVPLSQDTWQATKKTPLRSSGSGSYTSRSFGPCAAPAPARPEAAIVYSASRRDPQPVPRRRRTPHPRYPRQILRRCRAQCPFARALKLTSAAVSAARLHSASFHPGKAYSSLPRRTAAPQRTSISS